MVRTRSGKSTNSADKPQAAASPSKSPSKLKSPRSNPNEAEISLWYQLLIDFCIWKPTERTATYWLCFIGVMILQQAACNVFIQFNGELKFPEIYFFSALLLVHLMDVVATFIMEMKGPNDRLSVVLLFTESAANLTEIYLLLFTFGQLTPLIILLVSVITMNVLGGNVRFRDDDKLSVRVLSYTVLLVCLAWNYQRVYNDVRLAVYASHVCVAMLCDLTDFPDAYSDVVEMCEGLVAFARSVAFYCLVTYYLLWQTGDVNVQYTRYESALWSLVG